MASLFGFGSAAVEEPPPMPRTLDDEHTTPAKEATTVTPPGSEAPATNNSKKKKKQKNKKNNKDAKQPGGSAFRKAPIALIEVDEDSKFTVNPEAQDILEELEGKVCIVSIAGLYRTGKSSLVNFLLETETTGATGDEQGGFKVGPTVRRCTRGIWMWGSPRRAALASGEPCWVVVLDTEGLGGLEADQHYDTRIFSLATLLCSTLVYNSLGSIDESAISNLSFVANLSQHIRVSDDVNAAELDAHEFHKFFPSFIWVVRDFALDLVDEYGTAITSDEYLDRALRTQVGFDAATTERNRVRSMMTAFFTERHCFPLVRPLLDEAQLQEIDKVPFEELRGEFQEGVGSLKSHLYEGHLKPKEVNGRFLNGASFFALVKQYIEAIEGGSVPTISTAWEEVMLRECAEALQAALETYDSSMQVEDGVVVLAEKLYRSHGSALKKALLKFKERAGGEAAPSYQEKLETELDDRLAALLRANAESSRVFCRSTVQKLHDEIIATKMSSESAECYADVASLRFDVSTLGVKYGASASGPAKAEVLAEYGLGQSLETVQWLFERVEDNHEAKVVELEQVCSESAQALARAEAHEKVVAEALEAQQRELIAVSTAKMQMEAMGKAQEARMTSLLTELQRANRRREELENDLEDTKEALESEQTWQAQLHSRLEEMETKSDHKETKLDELGGLLEQHKTQGEERAVLLEQHKEREQSLAEQIGIWESKHGEIVAAHEAADKERQTLHGESQQHRVHAEREATKAKELSEKHAKLQEDHSSLKDKYEATTRDLEAAVSEQGASAAELEARLDAKEVDLENNADTISALQTECDRLKAVVAEGTKEAELASKKLDHCQAELDGANATHAELLRAHSQLGNEHRSALQKMNQRITYLKSQLDENQSWGSSTTSELQKKAVREIELEKRLDVEINLRATMTSDKEAQVFDLQKKLAESTTRLRQAESRSATLKGTLETAQTELNQVAAQRTVLLDEKEKMQALWEKSLTDHFNSLHETQSQLAETKESARVGGGTSASKMAEMESKLAEYRNIVERVQTKREGLLRKRTRSRLVKQTWHVKNFRLVGHALLHRDTDNAGAGEKTFALDANSKAEVVDDTGNGGRVIKNTFKVVNHKAEEIILAAIDRTDMNEWLSSLDDVIGDLVKNQKKNDDTKKRFKQEDDDDANGLNA